MGLINKLPGYIIFAKENQKTKFGLRFLTWMLKVKQNAY